MLTKFLITLVLLVTHTIFGAEIVSKKRPTSTNPSLAIAAPIVKIAAAAKPPKLTRMQMMQADAAKRSAEYEIRINAIEAAERRDWRLREARLAALHLGLVAQKGVTERIEANPHDYADYPTGYVIDVAKNRRAANQTYLGRVTQKMLEHVADPARKAPVFQALKACHDRILHLDAEMIANTNNAKDSTLDPTQRSEHHRLVARLEFTKNETIKKNPDTYRFLEDFTTRHFRSDTRATSGFLGLMAACETKMREQAKADRERAMSASSAK